MNIFISYNRHSAVVAKALAEDIKALGHGVWFDQELGGGQAWWAQILEKIRGCDVFVFVLDSASLNSTACKREWGYAADLARPILPVLVSEAVSTNLLPPALSQIQFVDYRTQDRDAAIHLARALATIPPAGPLPDPLPDPPETPVSYLGTLTAQIGTTSTLSYEEQSALVVDLKRCLRDPGSIDDARTLLETLRRRRELFATIAEEIDDLLGSSARSPRGGLSTPAAEIPVPKPPYQAEAASQVAGSTAPAPQVPQYYTAPVAPARPSNARKPTPRQRVTGAAILGVLGMGAGLVAAVVFSFSVEGVFVDNLLSQLLNPLFGLLALGGILAGFVSGLDWWGIGAATIAMGATAVLGSYFLYPNDLAWILLAVLAAPLLALVAVWVNRQVGD